MTIEDLRTMGVVRFVQPLDALRFHAERLNDILVDLHSGPDRAGQYPRAGADAGYVTQLIQQASQRVLTVDACHASLPGAAEDPWPMHKLQFELLARRARCRVLLDQEGVADATSAEWPQRLLGAGAAVRFCQLHLPNIMLVDGRFGLLSSPDGKNRISVVRDPAVLRTVRALFASLWDHAVSVRALEALRVTRKGDEMTRRVLELLGSGSSDEAAARQLDVSVRTYRRRVAELMSRLGARSRFHAGVRAAQLGLVCDHELS